MQRDVNLLKINFISHPNSLCVDIFYILRSKQKGLLVTTDSIFWKLYEWHRHIPLKISTLWGSPKCPFNKWCDLYNDWWRTKILLSKDNISPLMVNTVYLHYWSIHPGHCNLPLSSLQHFVLIPLMSHPLEQNLPCSHQLQVGYRPFALHSYLLL